MGGLGRQKLVVMSCAHMLICLLKFLCEHLFTFKFSALMPKISKENFADFSRFFFLRIGLDWRALVIVLILRNEEVFFCC